MVYGELPCHIRLAPREPHEWERISESEGSEASPLGPQRRSTDGRRAEAPAAQEPSTAAGTFHAVGPHAPLL